MEHKLIRPSLSNSGSWRILRARSGAASSSNVSHHLTTNNIEFASFPRELADFFDASFEICRSLADIATARSMGKTVREIAEKKDEEGKQREPNREMYPKVWT